MQHNPQREEVKQSMGETTETYTIGPGDVAEVTAAELGLAGAPPVDELANYRLDNEGDSKAVNEMLVPDGRYTTKSAKAHEFISKGREGTDKRIAFGVQADIVLAKDTTIDNGDGTKTTLQAGAYEDSIEFVFSHQRRNKDDGSPDGAFQKYLKLKATYAKVMGAEPVTVKDILSFIESYPLSLRIGRYDGKNWVHDIGAVKVA